MSTGTALILPSKGHINRCGEYLADGQRQEYPPAWFDNDRFFEAHAVISNYRAAHQRPLSSVTVGLRQIVRSETQDAPLVSQRLKRVPRIIRKLARMEKTNLARLEDIGGCRAVLDDAETLARVWAHVEKTWGQTIVRRRDYVQNPNAMGYRAIHLTVQRGGRRIEVQLRTQGQQSWANAIESADSNHNLTLKDGAGPESMLRYFSTAGDVIYHQEYGIALPDALRSRLNEATDKVITEGYYSRRRA